MSLDFCYVRQTEDELEVIDETKHDHSCDLCGEEIKKECMKSCDEDKEELCTDCTVLSKDEEEDS
jgi:hypothetical protein